MKETIIKSITAIICVVVLCITSSVAVGNYSDAIKEAAKLAPVATVGGNNAANDDADVPSDGTADVPSDDTADVPSDDTATDDATTPDAGTDATTPDAGTTDSAKPDAGADKAPAALTKADVIKIFNTETAKAAKGTYSFTRTGKFVNPINVGSATDAINGIIHGVDENASLDSVVGGFIGVKAQPITGTVKAGKAAEGVDAKYTIKAMNLTEADVTSFSVNGNKYTITIKDCTNPNASSAMAHATNDYITYSEVNKSIANEVGSAIKVVEDESSANYKKITFTATIVDGKMTALEYSYSFDATLKLKLTLIPATGTGSASITNKITGIKY